MRFCAASALATSRPVKPRDCSAAVSRSNITCGVLPPNGQGMPAPCTVTRRGRTKFSPEIGEILLGQALARQRELDDRHRRGAVIDDQRRRRAGRHLLEQGLRNRGDLRVRGGDIDRRVEEDLDDAEGGIRIRLDVLDVVDRRRQRALERGDDAPGHLVGRQALVLPGHADDRDVDARKNIDRHAQRGERAEEENEQGRDDERIGPAQRDADYSEHVGTGKR